MYYTIPPEPERRVRDMNSLQMHVGSRKETEVSDVSSGDADVKDKWTQTEECYHGKCLLMFTTFQFKLEKKIFEDRRIDSRHTNRFLIIRISSFFMTHYHSNIMKCVRLLCLLNIPLLAVTLTHLQMHS